MTLKTSYNEKFKPHPTLPLHWYPESYSKTFFDVIYEWSHRAYTRSTPYIFGIAFGYICYQCRHIHRVRGQKLPKILVILGWFSSMALCLTTVYGLAKYWDWKPNCLQKDSNCYSTVAAVLWAMFGRLAWSVGVAWVIFARYLIFIW